ncbi:MAG: biopolymer transporter Tol [Pseudomonadota bacterium]
MRPDFARRLDPYQISQLVIAHRDGRTPTVIYETGDLIEAPNWTPDGRWLIFNGDGRIWRISVDGAEGPTRINTAPVENCNNDHVLAPDGQTIYLSARDGHLYACPITGGTPSRRSNEADHRYYLHGVSPDGGVLSYVGLTHVGDKTVTRICTIPSAGGPDQFLTDGAHPVDGPEFSADGAWIYFNSEAAARAPGHAQIYRIRPDGTDLEQLTHDVRVNWFPHAAPDGTCFSFLSYPSGTKGHPPDQDVIIRLMDPNGDNICDIDRFNGGQGSINVNSWAPDSQRFAYVRYPTNR